ncbi:uncharacterized protein LOC123297817 [Chrysoperla carnea]|uniref:uncharacterized protein LOC123297817 n=1 Tax=Chrysoperla carnea TaxID=189513 RepID=UPI001D07060B|nr:uncharacterized protein LOC123297817 [Chrysoperla carnea]
MVNGLIIFTVCLQITALAADIKKLKTNQSKRRQATYHSASNGKTLNTLNGAAVPLPILKIQQNTGALPIVHVQQAAVHPLPQPVQPTPFTSHPVSQPIQPAPFTNRHISQQAQFTNHVVPQSVVSSNHLQNQSPVTPFSNQPFPSQPAATSYSNSGFSNHAHQSSHVNHATPVNTNQPIIDHNYNYEYAVHDAQTGDFKEHRESRQNGNVEGYYSLIEPNGRKRVVRYNSNPLNGFKAHVTYENVGNIPIQQVTSNNLDSNKQIDQQVLQQFSNQFPETHVSINTPVFNYKY